MCKFDQLCFNRDRLCSYQHTKSKNPPCQKDSEEFEDNQEKKFECEYFDFKTDSYKQFLCHKNKNHLESDDENDDPGVDLENLPASVGDTRSLITTCYL